MSGVIQSLDILQSLAFEEIAGHGENHGLYRLAKIEKESWQADILRQASGVSVVQTPASLREAIKHPKTVFIFVPADGLLNEEAVRRIMEDTVLKKTVIIEINPLEQTGVKPR